MKRSRILSVTAITLALAIGVLAGSRDRLFTSGAPASAGGEQPARTGASQPMRQSGAKEYNSDTGIAEIDSRPSESTVQREIAGSQSEDALFRVGGGLALTAERQGGNFIGYRIVESGDSEFAVDDVIVSVNGMTVEDSAAGSELLIIAIQDPDSQIEFRDRNE